MKVDENSVFVLAFLFLLICIINLMVKNNSKLPKETIRYNEVEEMFFYKIKNGSYSYKLLSIYTPLDLMMIRSLLLSEQIPYYIEFEHLMNLKPFVHSLNYNNSNLYILEEDYDDAIIVINKFVELKELNKYKISSTFRSIFEILAINWVTSSPNNVLGIDINYKNNRVRANCT